MVGTSVSPCPTRRYPCPACPAPAAQALAAAGITDLRQLDGRAEVLALHGLGPAQLGCSDALTGAELAFTDPVARPRPTGRNDNTTLAASGSSPRAWIEVCRPPGVSRTGCGCWSCSARRPARNPSCGARRWSGTGTTTTSTTPVAKVTPSGWGSVPGHRRSRCAGSCPTTAVTRTVGPAQNRQGCLYLTRLARIEKLVLQEMIAAGWARGGVE